MLYYIWIGMLSIGFILLGISIILIFALRIPDLVDELTGRKAKRQIKRLKELNLGTTGALDQVSTGDVYSAISTGSLLSKEISIITPEEASTELEEIKVEVSKAKVQTTEETDEATTDMNSTEVEEENKTDFIEEDSTSYIEDEDVTNLLSDIESHSLNKHHVVVIEEQSSI